MATILNKPLLANVRDDVDSALKSIGLKYGLSLKLGNCSFQPSSAIFKLEVSSIGDDGKVITKEMSDLQLHLKMLGLKPEHLEQVFEISGKKFKLAGFRRHATEKRFLIKSVDDGKVYLGRDSALYAALGIKPSDEGVDID